jgi:hypothetical protein
LPLSFLRVIGECNLDFKADYADLNGGSQMYPFDAEVSKINSEVSLKAREYETNAMQLLLGGNLTENGAEATGAIDGIANGKGTSVIDPATGITDISVTPGESGDMKEGKYVLKATAAKKVDVYCLSDVDFTHGTDTAFLDDDLKIGSLDFATGVDQTLADYGLTFEVGSGTMALVTNDTAEFYVRKPNVSSIELDFGQSSAEFSKVGVLLAGQKQSDGTIQTLELYNCIIAGMPIGFTEKAWSEWSITLRALYDSVKNKIGTYRRTIAA